MAEEDKDARLVDLTEAYKKGKNDSFGPDITLAELAAKCFLHYTMGDKEPISFNIYGGIIVAGPDKAKAGLDTSKKLILHIEISVREPS